MAGSKSNEVLEKGPFNLLSHAANRCHHSES